MAKNISKITAPLKLSGSLKTLSKTKTQVTKETKMKYMQRAKTKRKGKKKATLYTFLDNSNSLAQSSSNKKGLNFKSKLGKELDSNLINNMHFHKNLENIKNNYKIAQQIIQSLVNSYCNVISRTN